MFSPAMIYIPKKREKKNFGDHFLYSQPAKVAARISDANMTKLFILKSPGKYFTNKLVKYKLKAQAIQIMVIRNRFKAIDL